MAAIAFLMIATPVAIAQHQNGGSAPRGGAPAAGNASSRSVAPAGGGSVQNRNVAPPARNTNQQNMARPNGQNRTGPAMSQHRPIVITHDYHRCMHHPCVWFPGRWYYGRWYPSGWLSTYPEWYWFNWYGYSYEIGEFGVSGLKFDLDNIPLVDRALVEKGIVCVDRAEVGSVKQFAGLLHGPFHLLPGTHEVSVQLMGGREMNTTIAVAPGHVTHVHLRFGQKLTDPQLPIGPWPPQPDPFVQDDNLP